jgi:hypothetical protein
MLNSWLRSARADLLVELLARFTRSALISLQLFVFAPYFSHCQPPAPISWCRWGATQHIPKHDVRRIELSRSQ